MWVSASEMWSESGAAPGESAGAEQPWTSPRGLL